MKFTYSTNPITDVSVEQTDSGFLGYFYFLPDVQIKEGILDTTFEGSYQSIYLDHDMWVERKTPHATEQDERRILKVTFTMGKLDSIDFLFDRADSVRSKVIGYLNERHDKYNDTFKLFNYFKTKESAAK